MTAHESRVPPSRVVPGPAVAALATGLLPLAGLTAGIVIDISAAQGQVPWLALTVFLTVSAAAVWLAVA